MLLSVNSKYLSPMKMAPGGHNPRWETKKRKLRVRKVMRQRYSFYWIRGNHPQKNCRVSVRSMMMISTLLELNCETLLILKFIIFSFNTVMSFVVIHVQNVYVCGLYYVFWYYVCTFRFVVVSWVIFFKI